MSLERSPRDLNVDIFVLKIGKDMMSLQSFEVNQLFDFGRFSLSSDRKAWEATTTSLTALLWELKTSRKMCSKGRREDKLSTHERTNIVAAPQAKKDRLSLWVHNPLLPLLRTM